MAPVSRALLAATATAAAAATAAPPAPTPIGTLFAFGILSVPDDDHATAGVMTLNPTTGARTIAAPFPFAATDESALYCFLGWAPGSGAAGDGPRYFATTGPTPNVTTVDAASGVVLSDVPVNPPAYVLSFSYDDTRARGVALLANAANKLELAYVDTATGALTLLNASVPALFDRVIPCSQRLIPSHGWLLVMATVTDRDDGDETWLVLDYTRNGATVFEGPWSFAKHGRVNAFSELPPSAGPLAGTGVLATPKKDDATWGSLAWVNFTAPGDDVVVPLVDFAAAFAANSTTYSDVTMTLGCLTVAETAPGASYTAFILARDNGSETPLLIAVDLAVRGRGLAVVGAPRLTLLDEEGVAGDVYGLRWAPGAPAGRG